MEAALRTGAARAGHVAGRIGPNAVTRLSEAILARRGAEARDAVFRAAGCAHHVVAPPGEMVPDEDVARLHAALHAAFGTGEARAIGAEAGRRTAAYLLANRIPRAAQRVLGLLPTWLGLRLLLRAIGRHAWTFAGAGAFRVEWRCRQDVSETGARPDPLLGHGPRARGALSPSNVFPRASGGGAATVPHNQRGDERPALPTGVPTLVIAGGPVARRVIAREPICDYYAATFETLFRRVLDDRLRVTEAACSAMGDAECRFAVWRQ